MINRAERLFAQVSMDEAKRELESARKDLAVAQQAFKSLINMEEGSDVRTTTPLFINEALPPAQYFKDLVPMNNYIVNQLKLQQVVADNQLRSAGPLMSRISLYSANRLCTLMDWINICCLVRWWELVLRGIFLMA